MSFNGFVNFGDIKGESTDKDHKDWVEVMGYHQSVSRPLSVEPKNVVPKTGPVHSEFHIVKLLDVASPKLYEACFTGKHIKEVTIEAVSAKGGKPYLKITLKDVLISGVADGADPSGPVQLPMETVSLAYGAIEFTYTRQKPDGSAADSVTGKWDLPEATAA